MLMPEAAGLVVYGDQLKNKLVLEGEFNDSYWVSGDAVIAFSDGTVLTWSFDNNRRWVVRTPALGHCYDRVLQAGDTPPNSLANRLFPGTDAVVFKPGLQWWVAGSNARRSDRGP